MERVAVFIDNGYFKVVQRDSGIAVDYEKFSEEIVGDKQKSERFRTYVYDCPPYQSNPPSEEEISTKKGFDSFKYNVGRCRRFEFRTGRLQVQRDEAGEPLLKKDGRVLLKQKGVDMALGIDVAKLAATKQVQRIVLVAGDSDFVPAIIAAKSEGVLVTLYYSPSGILHDSLFEACDDRLHITNELLEKCKRPQRIRR